MVRLSFDLDGPFVAYVGWLIPWGTPSTLLGETTEQVQAAQRELARIGIDRPVAQAVGGPVFWADDADELATTERVDFAQLADIVGDNPTPTSSTSVSIWSGSQGTSQDRHHMPFYQVPDRILEIPRDRPVYVSCGSGYRAAAVVSLLRSGDLRTESRSTTWFMSTTTGPTRHARHCRSTPDRARPTGRLDVGRVTRHGTHLRADEQPADGDSGVGTGQGA